MGTLTVRVNPLCHSKLRELAVQTNQPMVIVLEKAVEEYRRKQFLERVNADFWRLKKNKKAWKEELQERALWDAALSDGLEGVKSGSWT